MEPCILGCRFHEQRPKLTRQMTMITHSIFSEFFVIDVTKSGVIISRFVMHGHYHTSWELKLFINFLDILFKCVYKYLRNIIIVMFFYKSNWFLRIECVVKNILFGNKIRWGCVSDTAWCSSCQGLGGMLTAVV